MTDTEKLESLENKVRGLELVVDVISSMIPKEEYYRAKDRLFALRAAQRSFEEGRTCSGFPVRLSSQNVEQHHHFPHQEQNS